MNLAGAILAVTVLAGALHAQTAGPPVPERRTPDAEPAAVFRADRWLGSDKAKHAAASMLLCGAAGWLLHNRFERPRHDSRLAGAVFSLSLGVFKELNDHRSANNRFSWKDLAADFLGVVIGGLLLVW
ncbi:hypothetical protein JXO52_17715 [bacterium]|nr:hypothetical protein [bacterium]